MGIPVAVEPHDGAEGTESEPAHQQFVEVLGTDVAAEETADVSVPPGDTGHAHVQAGDNLTAEGGEVGLDVAGPGQGAVLLGAGPGTADQADDVIPAAAFMPS